MVYPNVTASDAGDVNDRDALVPVRCSLCHRPVDAEQSARARLARHGPLVICLDCFLGAASGDQPVAVSAA